MSVKRNDPCTCGSGKKYKKCCLQAPIDCLSGKNLRICIQTLYPLLEEYATQHFGRSVITAGWQSFSRWGVAAVTHEEETYRLAFTAWFLFSRLPDDEDLTDEKFLVTAPDHAIATDFLKSSRAKLSPLKQSVIKAAISSPYSFYSILSAEPGNRLRVQDIYTQKQVVVEVEGNDAYTVGDVLFSAVLSVDGVSILFGCMPLALAANCQQEIESHREKWQADVGNAIDQRLLYLHDTELRRYYFLLLSQIRRVELH